MRGILKRFGWLSRKEFIRDMRIATRDLKAENEELARKVVVYEGELAVNRLKLQNFEHNEKMKKENAKIVDLTAAVLDQVVSGDVVEHLEKRIKNHRDFWKWCEALGKNKYFDLLIDTTILTYLHKLGAESVGVENDMLNRGGMHGAQLVRTIALKAAQMAAPSKDDEDEQFDPNKAL